MVNTCKKCNFSNDLSYRIEEIELHNDEIKLEIAIYKDMLDIFARWHDDVRDTTMAMRAMPKINYCPWCGRMLPTPVQLENCEVN